MVSITRAAKKDVGDIHAMQVKAFLPLLEKYQDYAMSPACENEETISGKMEQASTTYFLLHMDGENVGAIRVVEKDKETCRIAPIFIVPEFQGKGIAQQTFALVEEQYPLVKRWELDTILQEKGNCYLYEKLGYRRTGKTEEIKDNMTVVFYAKSL